MTAHLISYTHTGLSLLDNIAPFFSPIRIYVPWGGMVNEHEGNSDIVTLYPPEEFKPDADFKTLLDDCFNWALEQGEKSRKEIVKTGHTNPTSDESLRHIKTILSDRITDTSQKDTVLRWHMLLHLANRLEENRSDANRMLEDLNKKPSPLLNNADLPENSHYPLENLRGIDPDFFINDANIKMLIKAWIGLFGSLINKGNIVLTLNRRIFELLSEECNNCFNKDLKNPEIITFKGPLHIEGTAESPRMNIADEIEKIVTSKTNPEDRITELRKISSKFESLFQADKEENQILFSLQFFQAAKVELKDPLTDFFSGKTLILAE